MSCAKLKRAVLTATSPPNKGDPKQAHERKREGSLWPVVTHQKVTLMSARARLVCTLGLCLTLLSAHLGCATPAPKTPAAPTTPEPSPEVSQAQAPEPAPATTPLRAAPAPAAQEPTRASLPTPPQGPHITALRWTAKGELHVGYSHGQAAKLDAKGKKVAWSSLGGADEPLLAFSPDGAAALLGGSPGKVVRLKDGGVLLPFQHFTRRALTGAWTPDGKTLFVAEEDGPLYIWRDADQLPALLDKRERLERFLHRQEGDARARLGAIEGKMLAGDGPSLMFERPDGQLIWWHLTRPGEALQVIKLRAPATFIAVSGGKLLVTNAADQLRVSQIEERGMLGWSRDARGVMIGADEALPEVFLSWDRDKLALRRVEDGEPVWQIDWQGRWGCGIALDPKRERAAVCVDNTTQVIALKDGKAQPVTLTLPSKGATKR